MLQEYYRIDAYNVLNNLYSTASGFSGGEGCQQLEASLRQRIDADLDNVDVGNVVGNPEDYEDIDPNMSIEELLGVSIKAIGG